MIPVVAGQYKLVLVGDSSVGKSSLLCQFVDGKFDDKLLSTIGVDFKFRRVKLGTQQIKLQIWDTAGQQTFRSIVSAYYNSADAIILCYDMSNYDSFESLKDYWLPQAQNNNKTNAKVFVIGNKLDCKREVEAYSLDALKQHTINGLYEVSAKQNKNVDNTFMQIAKILHNQHSNKKEQSNNKQKIANKLSLARKGPRPNQQQVIAETKKKPCCK